MAGIAQGMQALSLSGKSKLEQEMYRQLEGDNYKDVVVLASKNANQVTSLGLLYQAYALYRLGKEQECIDRLSKVTDAASSRVVKHLKAQAYYRLEEPSQALEQYAALSSISGTKAINEEDDLAVNKLACQVQQAKDAIASEECDVPSDDRPHEQHFNYSLVAAAAGDAQSALQHLEKAERALKGIQLDADDEAYEMAPIHLQRAHLTGDASLNIKAKTLKTDAVTQFLATVNFLDFEGNPYALHKAYKQPLKSSARLFSNQERLLAYNKIIAADAVGVSIRKAVDAYCTQYAQIDSRRCAALRQLLLKRTTLRALQDKVADESVKKQDRAAAAVVAISRLVTQPRGFARSLALLEVMPLADHPGLLALQCCLMDVVHGKPTEDAITRIEAALSSATANTRGALLAGLIQRRLQLERTESQKSAIQQAATQLLQLDARHPVALAALAIVDPSASQEMRLPDLSGIDVDALERNLPLKRSREEQTQAPRPVKAKKVKTEEQLKQESNLDPERWLPKRDRASYKPTRQEKAKGEGAHQGGAVDERLGEARVMTPLMESAAGGKDKKKKGKSKK
ncbi:hypothetical protein BCR37DRAFT_376389 [Protomyces lactucae-debilis]|uniref:Signal recognition particle subunit SRP72 n=1 Tax=Protomyces lactucae-debilis TaxID=2754530 RepID=A0A1Y2FSQ2_PROLT|nr:uncharacterized protein BCR37DRAFT_376389 [Protomyces lactucae-debilis]ORY87031.1 hypothetical protein BCR37DRAFT_376389 [Protomyces lactucae-debilis]